MRKLVVLLFVPLFLMSCGETKLEKELRLKNDSLQALVAEGGDELQQYLNAFSEIQGNLDKIKQQENIITVNASGDIEQAQTKKEQINEDILTIYKLMLENKEKLAALQRKVNNSQYKNSELNKMIQRMTKEMEEKDAQIFELKTKLEQMNLTVEGLNTEIAGLSADIDTFKVKTEKQTAVIEQQTTEMNTAFYAIGTKKELYEQQILTKEGGFVGIGGVQKLHENFNKDYFKKIDIRSTKSIPLFVKKATLVTSHPTSFRFAKTGDKIDSLVITDAKKFWSVSKYLVIMVD
jgi:chromosome segregation ATPase